MSKIKTTTFDTSNRLERLENNLLSEPRKVKVLSRRERLNRVIRMLRSAATELEFERDALPQQK